MYPALVAIAGLDEEKVQQANNGLPYRERAEFDDHVFWIAPQEVATPPFVR